MGACRRPASVAPALVLPLAFTMVGIPGPAHAHLVDTGFGAFYDGLVHLFATPEDLLPVVALTLWVGLRGPAFGRAVLVALPLAWIVGVAAAQGWTWPWPASLTTAATTVVLGALAAADRPVRLSVVVALATAVGLAHGVINGAVLARAGLGAPGGAGIACGLIVVVSLGGGLAVTLRPAWTRIGVRVAGSWIAATGLLMLGWGLRS